MHKFSENLFQNAIDLNETIVFEYHLHEDIITFSENIKKYIPMPLRVSAFVNKMDYLGKIYSDDVEKAISFFTSLNEVDKVRMEYIRFLDFAGDFCWYQLKGKFEFDSEGVPILLYGTLAYIDDETKHEQEERAIAKDALTKLMSKESFFAAATEYINEIPADVVPSLMVIDLDDFEDWKSVYSEVSSEGVMIEIARILKRAFRGSDLIGRIMEDRFMVVMKGIHATNILLERAAYIRQTVKEVWSDFDNNGALTVSIGISAMNNKTATFDLLHARALAALADAQNSGKDNYVLYSGDDERLDINTNPILSSKEMEMIRNILDPVCTWAYAVDENFQLLYRNSALNKRMNNPCSGLCYLQNKGYGEPCPDCPILKMDERYSSYDCNVYSTSLRSAIPMRVTRIIMRNGKSVYLLVSVNENIEDQLATMNESEQRTQNAMFAMQDVIWDINLDKNLCVRIKEQNVNSIIDTRIENYRKLVARFSEEAVHPEDCNLFFKATDPKYLRQAFKSGRRLFCNEIRLRLLDGSYEWYGVYTMFLNPQKEVSLENQEISAQAEVRDDVHVMVVCLNVNEYKKHSIEEVETKIKHEIMREKSSILKDMALSYERHENVNDMIGMLVFEYTVADASYYLCSNFDDIFTLNDDMLKDEWSLLENLNVFSEDRDIYEKFLNNAKESNMIQKVTVRIYNKFGVPTWYTIVLEVLRGINNQPVRFLGTLQNVNAEMEIKAEMEYRADYDSLTGLYNSETFYRKAGELIRMKDESNFAILVFDIDRFRLINDRYGIDTGNRALFTVGKIIREVSPKGSIAKRYQADEFSVLLEYDTDQDLVNYMTELSGNIRDSKLLPMSLSAYFGIYKITDKNVPVRLMCDRARAVKKQVKGNALTNYGVYDDVIRLKLREQAEIEEEMFKALANHEFVMYLQPQIDLSTEKIIGAEALVRWNHPLKGVMVPAQFLGLFESNGFITKMDMYIWEEACAYLADLQSRGIYLPISVNISRVHIGKTDLADILIRLVHKYNIEARFLELEITENLFIDDVDELFAEMAKLKSLGFRIHMDDFGSGYSSLNMLRNAPLDTLKIDRFFLDEIMSTERGKIIVEASVRMAKQLGLVVIAEGVETVEQLDFLKGIGTDIAQGYYYSKPIARQEFEVFVEKYR